MSWELFRPLFHPNDIFASKEDFRQRDPGVVASTTSTSTSVEKAAVVVFLPTATIDKTFKNLLFTLLFVLPFLLFGEKMDFVLINSSADSMLWKFQVSSIILTCVTSAKKVYDDSVIRCNVERQTRVSSLDGVPLVSWEVCNCHRHGQCIYWLVKAHVLGTEKSPSWLQNFFGFFQVLDRRHLAVS